MKDYEKEMKIVITLDGQHLRINIPKTLPKHVAKKQEKEHAATLATLTCKPTFLTLASENTIRL